MDNNYNDNNIDLNNMEPYNYNNNNIDLNNMEPYNYDNNVTFDYDNLDDEPNKLSMNSHDMEQPIIMDTSNGAKDGQNKCPKCGATDISMNMQTGKLRCNFCRHEFDAAKVQEQESAISGLRGIVIGSGAQDIKDDVDSIITLKCSSCGAEIVIDTSEAMQARCHWCRNTLSINEQVPNGAVPDYVLPFSVKKEEAQELIEDFVKKRKFFAHPRFKREFKSENIMGVYFPYMVVDVNGHASYVGQGEHLLRRYTRGSGDDEETYYDYEVYDIAREFDIAIDNLTVESSADKLSTASNKTNNIINSILPFDVENTVAWNANYLKGFTSEKRDMNIKQLKSMVDEQAKDVARYAANETLQYYDRGVKWSKDELNIVGERWCAAHFPVWLYSYHQKKGRNDVLHYVAVNARTKETMGSVPIHMPKLIGISFLVEVLSGFATYELDFDGDILLLSLGVIFFLVTYAKYRNQGARHHHELETDKEITNVSKYDNFVTKKTQQKNSRMKGANNIAVKGNKFGSM